MDAYCEVEGLAGLGLRAYDDISDLDEDTYDSLWNYRTSRLSVRFLDYLGI